MKIVCFIFLIISACCGDVLKIYEFSKQNDEIRLKFSGKINEQILSRHAINGGIYYDIKATLAIKKKNLELKNSEFRIASNTKTITRLVILSKQIEELNLNIAAKELIFSFKKDEIIKSDIISLFQDIDSKAPSAESNKTAIENVNLSLNKNRIIVLDPGHGGKDCGAIFKKVCEKGIVLKISNKAANILKNRGYKVFVTRSSDKYISLQARTKFANDKNADVFISIHANALDKKSPNYKSANGIETYFLSTARSERARKVAELENKGDIEDMNYFSKISFLNSINSQRLLSSNKLAIDIQSGMLQNARTLYAKTTDGGVREGPFWVLAGALMPSILIEIGYMTNENELTKMQEGRYQDLLARGIADGIDGYFLKNF